MPGRKIPLITDEIYHVVNRGVASQSTFLTSSHYQRALEVIFYYQSQNPPLRFSFFNKLTLKQREEILNRLKTKKDFVVEIIAYCLMPTHLHLLLKQTKDKGISIFMSNVTNSYTKYFNTKQKRFGHLFQGKFKANRIENDEQLIHTSRYIHLNPFSSSVVKNLNKLPDYPYSSLSEYLGNETCLCQKEIVLEQFKTASSYKKFVFDQAKYQKELQLIKNQILE